MANYWRHVNRVIREADIIILVLDARSITGTRHIELESKIRFANKVLLYVITKCDLLPLSQVQNSARTLKPSVFISSTHHLGTTILKKKILEISHGKPVTVGVVGYPNVGKSSLINAISGRGSARTSPQSGFTQGLQKIRIDSRIMLIDTPGVFSRTSKDKKDETKFAKIGSIDYGKLKDPESAALSIISDHPLAILNHYQVKSRVPDININPETILEKIAVKIHLLRKGNQPDTHSAAVRILRDWQSGRIKPS